MKQPWKTRENMNATETKRTALVTGAFLSSNSGPLLTPASGRAEDARQAGTEPLNGNGFYRFNIGDFQATVISDGYGPFRCRYSPRTPLKLNSLRC